MITIHFNKGGFDMIRIDKLNKNIKEVKKGDVIECIWVDTYDNSTVKSIFKVERNGKKNVSVVCINGYLMNSSFKISKDIDWN